VRVRHYIGVMTLLILIAGCSSDSGTESPATTTATPATTTSPSATTEAPSTTIAPTTTSTIAPVQEPVIDLESGLLAHYPLDGDATDSGPAMLDGEVFEAVATADRFGNSAGALLFDGVDDLVTLDSGRALGGTFSLAMWINGNGASDHQWVILSDHAAGECQPATPSWILRYNADAGVFFSIYDTTTECGSHYGFGSPVLLDDNTWHHVTLVASDGNLAIYLDCQEVLSGSEPIDLPDGPYEFLVGNQTGSPASTALDGALDDLRIYDRALEQPDLDALCMLP